MLVVSACLALFTCRMPFEGSAGSLAIPVRGPTARLSWDHSPRRLTHGGADVAHFRLYYRELGATEWRRLTDVPGGRPPTFLVDARSILGSRSSGRFEFGVATVSVSGRESTIHASTDYDATPPGGWHVVWER